MFVDRTRIYAKAGDGGRGGCSFLRETGRPFGGPDGGNGGRGGSVILEVDPHENNLVALKYAPHQFAKNGMPGINKQKTGKSAKDLIIKVPPGTVVSLLSGSSIQAVLGRPSEPILPMPDTSEKLETLADLTEPGQRFVLCEGGDGGRGNMNFKSSTNQAPRRFEEGWPGEWGQFLLELKSIADVGLVGYPNAGKSTLLSRLSNAHPKIAPYPFTTLTPMIGVAEYPDLHRVTVADIPGIIEGAHEGVGLGFEFLRHIERCRLLLFVLDTAGSEGRDPRDDFAALRKELKSYRADLAERPFLVVANKMDLPESAANLKKLKTKLRHPIIPISADQSDNLETLKNAVREALG